MSSVTVGLSFFLVLLECSEPFAKQVSCFCNHWCIRIIAVLWNQSFSQAALFEQSLIVSFGWPIRRQALLVCNLREVDVLEKSVTSDIFGPTNKIAIPLAQVVHRQVPDQAFGVFREAFWEGDFLTQCHFEHFIGVLVHEGRPTHDQLVGKDAKSVPVCCSPVTYVKNDFRWDVLRRTTESVCAIPGLEPLDETKVSQFDIAV